ncbi:MAG TPA: SCP2 sterol-binding domain-containing protein [Solirubrobacteraceae bacterium]|nr:SCP2 sterol-binding domain-containing protein [Solirubrobacteraceae bacterium]
MDFGFDPQRALDQLKKLAADAPAQIADGLGRLVRDATPERLDQVMKSPARRPLLDGIFWSMPKQLDTKAAANIKTTVRWNITGRADEGVDTYLLEIDKGMARTNRGSEGPDPKLTITMDGVEFLRLISGNSDPMSAYFKGRIQLAGDIMVAAQLAQIFKMPGGGAEPAGGDRPNGANGGGELDDPSTH